MWADYESLLWRCEFMQNKGSGNVMLPSVCEEVHQMAMWQQKSMINKESSGYDAQFQNPLAVGNKKQ